LAIKIEVVIGMLDAPSPVEANMVNELTQLGYFPSVGTVPTPFTTKQVQHILQSVMPSHHSYPGQKERVSTRVVGLQEVMMYDKSTHSKSFNHNCAGLAMKKYSYIVMVWNTYCEL
jgi:hypothetical protein